MKSAFVVLQMLCNVFERAFEAVPVAGCENDGSLRHKWNALDFHEKRWGNGDDSAHKINDYSNFS